MKKQLFWTFAGLSSFAVSLVALAPLPVLAQQLMKWKPGIELAGISGNLWRGQVQRVTTPQAVINDLSWNFAPQKLLSGYLAADMEAEVKTVQLRGQCGVSIARSLHCSPLRAELDAANVERLLPAGRSMPVQLGGNLIANLDDITWDRMHVPVANGRLLWDEGKVDGMLKLDLGGRYQANLQGDQDGKALVVDLQSDGTAVVLSGNVDVEPQGGIRLRFSCVLRQKPIRRSVRLWRC
ncbi:MAG: type II secretion system protein N [Thiolinea sp.]